jgi:hypothetical protein
MILAALLMLGGISQAPAIDILDDAYSVETKKRYEEYVRCFATAAYDRRQAAGSPEAHMREAKAACRREYDSFVAGVVKDLATSSDATSAAIRARAFLDEMDARAVMGPPAPAKLAQLPVERLIGVWRMGGGPLAVDMNVRFADDGSLVGTLKSDFKLEADGLRSWKVTSDGTKQAVFHAAFADGRVVNYVRVPSFPGEMDFINSADPAIQRFDLLMEDNDLLIRWVTPEAGTQLRFRRQTGAAQGNERD